MRNPAFGARRGQQCGHLITWSSRTHWASVTNFLKISHPQDEIIGAVQKASLCRFEQESSGCMGFHPMPWFTMNSSICGTMHDRRGCGVVTVNQGIRCGKEVLSGEFNLLLLPQWL
jgi:hypothetical protein